MAFLIVGGNKSSRKGQIQKLYQKIKPQAPQTDPDTIILQAPTNIGIEEVRNLRHQLSLKSYGQPPKIAIIDQAQNLTWEAQAALGKLLEEPPGETVIILASPNQELVLPTIVSRCQIIILPTETEISLTKEEMKKFQAELEEILKCSAGERIKFVQNLKSREEAEKFCQIQLFLWREVLLKKPTPEISKIIRQIQKTQKYLAANVNYRLAIENLLLFYPETDLH